MGGYSKLILHNNKDKIKAISVKLSIKVKVSPIYDPYVGEVPV